MRKSGLQQIEEYRQSPGLEARIPRIVAPQPQHNTPKILDTAPSMSNAATPEIKQTPDLRAQSVDTTLSTPAFELDGPLSRNKVVKGELTKEEYVYL